MQGQWNQSNTNLPESAGSKKLVNETGTDINGEIDRGVADSFPDPFNYSFSTYSRLNELCARV